jgi:hypothetical protein
MLRLRLSGERLAHARLRTVAARLSLRRRDERERSRGRRAVVVRDPQRERDERLGQLLDDAPDGSDVHTGRCVHSELDYETAALRVTEADFDDRADTDVLRHFVRERTRDGACGHERIDGGERDPSRLLGGHEKDGAALAFEPLVHRVLHLRACFGKVALEDAKVAAEHDRERDR